MISRRTLFTRLSAIALAPLAKWLPKEEAPAEWYPAGWGAELPDGAYNWTALPHSSLSRTDLDALVAEFNSKFNLNNGWIDVPGHQEAFTMAAEVPAAMSPELTAPHFRASFNSQEEVRCPILKENLSGSRAR
jgi:hypothetical protein